MYDPYNQEFSRGKRYINSNKWILSQKKNDPLLNLS